MGYIGLERRCGIERRKRKRSLLKRWMGEGNRKSTRRADGRSKIVVFDQYPSSLMHGTLVVLTLSLLDATLTLILLSQGAVELNPIMRYYLNHGPTAFLLAKYGLTVLSLFIIVISYEAMIHRHQICSKILPLFSTLFGGVIIWELYLLSII